MQIRVASSLYIWCWRRSLWVKRWVCYVSNPSLSTKEHAHFEDDPLGSFFQESGWDYSMWHAGFVSSSHDEQTYLSTKKRGPGEFYSNQRTSFPSLGDFLSFPRLWIQWRHFLAAYYVCCTRLCVHLMTCRALQRFGHRMVTGYMPWDDTSCDNVLGNVISDRVMTYRVMT